MKLNFSRYYPNPISLSKLWFFLYVRSPGYGISLVAETTSGCLISADSAVCYTQEDLDRMNDSEEKPDLLPPEDLGVRVASMLLGEIEQGGVVDSTHQVGCVLSFFGFHFPVVCVLIIVSNEFIN